MKCPACERMEAIKNLIKNPTSENREKASQMLGFEKGFILSGIKNMSEMKGCPLHSSFAKYKDFLFFLNCPRIKDLLFPKSETGIS